MGTSRSPKELARKTDQVAKVIVGRNRDAVAAAADVYKDAVLHQGRLDSGGDLRLSRWGRNGLRLNAGYDVDGQAVATAKLRPRPQGPWKVLEYGAKPHIIVAGLTRRQGQALALFSFMSGGAGSFDLGELASIAAGNRNNRRTSRSRQRSRLLAVTGLGRSGQGVAWANHPGTKPKNTWSNGIERGTRGAIDATRRVHRENIAKVFQ